jgi:hypothetical protein
VGQRPRPDVGAPRAAGDVDARSPRPRGAARERARRGGHRRLPGGSLGDARGPHPPPRDGGGA